MELAPQNLFAYGTLMVSEVVWNLLGRSVDTRPAQVRGFKRFRVRDAVYPGVVTGGPKDILYGMLLLDLTESDWQILDKYEGNEYHRISVMAHQDQSVDIAEIYLFKEPQNLTQEPWDDSKVLEQLSELGFET